MAGDDAQWLESQLGHGSGPAAAGHGALAGRALLLHGRLALRGAHLRLVLGRRLLVLDLHLDLALDLLGLLLDLAAEDADLRLGRRGDVRRHRDGRAGAAGAAGAAAAAAVVLLEHRAHPTLVLAAVGLDRVVAALADLELDHHVVVLVHQVVAVHHVLALLVLEAHDHAHLLGLADVDDVLRALLVVLRRLAVAVEDLEVHEVDVDRVEPSAARVLELPDLDGVLLRVGDRQLVLGVDDVLPRLAVDGPVAVLALEADVADDRRAGVVLADVGRGEAHDVHVRVEVVGDLVVARVVDDRADLERHDDAGRVEVDVVPRARVLEDDLLAGLVLREVDDDLVALGHADLDVRARLRVGHEAAVGADDVQRLPRGRRTGRPGG